MLDRVLGVDRDSIGVHTLQALIDGAQTEHQALEFKSELPGPGDVHRDQLTVSVAADLWNENVS